MFKCNARCAEDESISMERLDGCIDECSRVLHSFNEDVSRELETFQVSAHIEWFVVGPTWA